MKSNLSHDKCLFVIIVAAIIFFIGYAHKRSFRLQNYKKMIIWPNYSWTFSSLSFYYVLFFVFDVFILPKLLRLRKDFFMHSKIAYTLHQHHIMHWGSIEYTGVGWLNSLRHFILLVISLLKVPGVECRLFFSSVEIVLKKSERTNKKSTCGNLNRHTSTCSTHTLKWLSLHGPFT